MLTVPTLRDSCEKRKQGADGTYAKTNNNHYMRFIKDFCEDERNCSPGQKNRKRKKEKDEGEKSELTLSNKSFPLYNDKAVH